MITGPDHASSPADSDLTRVGEDERTTQFHCVHLAVRAALAKKCLGAAPRFIVHASECMLHDPLHNIYRDLLAGKGTTKNRDIFS